MLFREPTTPAAPALAISQLTHAWLSGQILRAFDAPLGEPLLLAAEQHDIGWLDWERAPSFDAGARRPPTFREVGAVVHAPMWTAGVERALSAWGPHVALLISRHGGRIYRRFGLPFATAADAAAIHGYLAAQAPREAEWVAAAGLDEAELDRQSALVAFVDALSLAVCGALRLPADLDFGNAASLRVAEVAPWDFRLDPWPFRDAAFEVEGQGRRLPSGGVFADEAAMRAWLKSASWEAFSARLAPA
jgi:Protein of unknown function (DUF3891)